MERHSTTKFLCRKGFYHPALSSAIVIELCLTLVGDIFLEIPKSMNLIKGLLLHEMVKLLHYALRFRVEELFLDSKSRRL